MMKLQWEAPLNLAPKNTNLNPGVATIARATLPCGMRTLLYMHNASKMKNNLNVASTLRTRRMTCESTEISA